MERLRQLDFFSIPIQFSFQDKPKAQSTTGCLLSLVSLVLLILIIINNSSELWLRKQPQLSISNYFKYQKIYLKDFPFVLAFADNENKPINDIEGYLNFYAILFNIGENLITSQKVRKLVKCNQKMSSFSEQSQQSFKYIQVAIQNQYCFDFEQEDYIIGDFNSNNSQIVSITALVCQGQDYCKNKDQIISELTGFKAVLYFPSTSSINGQSYEEPILMQPQSTFMLGSFDLYKYLNIQIQNIELNSDNGVLSQNWSFYRGYSILDYKMDYLLMKWLPIGTQLFTISIATSNTVQLTTRVYLKFAESLAKVMGFATFTYYILSLVMFYYQKFVFHIKLYQRLLVLGIKVIQLKNDEYSFEKSDSIQTNQTIQDSNVKNLKKLVVTEKKITEKTLIIIFIRKFIYKILKKQETDRWYRNLLNAENSINYVLSIEGLIKILANFSFFINKFDLQSDLKDVDKETIETKHIYISNQSRFFNKEKLNQQQDITELNFK